MDIQGKLNNQQIIVSLLNTYVTNEPEIMDNILRCIKCGIFKLKSKDFYFNKQYVIKECKECRKRNRSKSPKKKE